MTTLQTPLSRAVDLAFNSTRLTPSQAWIAVARVMITQGIPLDGAETDVNWNIASWVLETDPQAMTDVMAGMRDGRTLMHAVEQKSGLRWLDFWEKVLERKPWGAATPASVALLFNERRFQRTINGDKVQSGRTVVPLVRRGHGTFYPYNLNPSTDSDGYPNILLVETASHTLLKFEQQVAGEKTGKRIESTKLADLKSKAVSPSSTSLIVDSNDHSIRFKAESYLFAFMRDGWADIAHAQRRRNRALRHGKATTAFVDPSFSVLVGNALTSVFTVTEIFKLLLEAKNEVQKEFVQNDSKKTHKDFGVRFLPGADDLFSVAWCVTANGKTDAQVAVNPTSKDQIVQVFCSDGFRLIPISSRDGHTQAGALTRAGFTDPRKHRLLLNLCEMQKKKDKAGISSAIRSASSRWGTGLGAFGMTYR
ncbi:hypothetical protein JCM16303_005088 [Sporobolomyces ruberrimus]